MIPVILETPYAGDVERNIEYARKCMVDCLERGEAPFASHLLYTQCLDDNNDKQRRLGIDAGFAWRSVAKRTVVYTDLGISRGMELGIAHAKSIGHEIVERSLKRTIHFLLLDDGKWLYGNHETELDDAICYAFYRLKADGASIIVHGRDERKIKIIRIGEMWTWDVPGGSTGHTFGTPYEAVKDALAKLGAVRRFDVEGFETY